MSFRIAKDEIVTSLNAIRRLKIPIYTALPTNLAGTGGYFAGLSVSGGGVDLYYFDGDMWFKIVDSSALSSGLPNTLAINNNSGGVDNIILDNTINASVGALTSIAAGDLNIFAGAGAVGVAPAATTSDVRIASGTGAGAMVNIDAGPGGLDVDTDGPLALDSTSVAASNITTLGAAGGTGDLTITTTAGSLTLVGGEADVAAVRMIASNAAGGVTINAGTAGIAGDTSGPISLDSTSVAASNITILGAPAGGDLTVTSTAGSLNLVGGEADIAAVRINASDATGGIDIDAGTGGLNVDTTGPMSFDSTSLGGTNITILGSAGGPGDLTITNTDGSLILTAGEPAADAVQITAGDAAGGIILTAGTAATTANNGFIVKSDAAAAIAGVTTLSADDSGGIFSVAKTSAYTITLPTPAQGLYFKFLILDTGANIVTFTSPGAFNEGIVSIANVATAATGTSALSASAASVGDWISYEGIDATHYLVTGACIAAADWSFT